jgi:hypothetical protein
VQNGIGPSVRGWNHRRGARTSPPGAHRNPSGGMPMARLVRYSVYLKDYRE